MKTFQACRMNGTSIGLPHGNFQTALNEAQEWHRKNGQHVVVMVSETVWTSQTIDEAMKEAGVEG